MGVKKGKKIRRWAVSEKLEIVKARENGLTYREIESMYGVYSSALTKWMRGYEQNGIGGLEDAPREGVSEQRSAKVEAAAKMVEELAQEDPTAGISKIQGALYRRGFLDLARETVRKLLRGQGRGPQEQGRRRRNPQPKVHNFERANPNDLWQTDIMTFMLKGQYRLYLIGFMDDNSRFIVGWGLYRFQTAANVLEVFRAGIEKHGMPKEVLSDNGRQYYTWRGRSQFTKMLTKLGIRHIRSRPYHPQTCGKIESFWRNLLQECLTRTPLSSFEEAKAKIGEWIEYYNFKRPHQGIGNLMPSDRFYRVADQVKQIIEQNTVKIEEQKAPLADYTPPTYIVGNIGGKELRVVAKEAEVSLRDAEPKNIESGGADNGFPAASLAISSPGKAGPGNISEGKEDHGTGSQAAQPAREIRADHAGADAPAAGCEPLPAGGGVAGAVLPMDQPGPASGVNGACGQDAGAQGGVGGAGCGGPAQGIEGQDREAGGRKEESAQGEGPLNAGGGVCAEDHQAPGLGPVSGA